MAFFWSVVDAWSIEAHRSQGSLRSSVTKNFQIPWKLKFPLQKLEIAEIKFQVCLLRRNTLSWDVVQTCPEFLFLPLLTEFPILHSSFFEVPISIFNPIHCYQTFLALGSSLKFRHENFLLFSLQMRRLCFQARPRTWLIFSRHYSSGNGNSCRL